MEELINIAGKQFYYSTMDQLIERCSQKEKCALIIDNDHIDELLNKAMDIIGTCVNQLIIVSGNVNTTLPHFIGKDVLIMAADNFEEAVRFAIYGDALSKEVICIPKEEDNIKGKIVDIII